MTRAGKKKSGAGLVNENRGPGPVNTDLEPGLGAGKYKDPKSDLFCLINMSRK